MLNNHSKAGTRNIYIPLYCCPPAFSPPEADMEGKGVHTVPTMFVKVVQTFIYVIYQLIKKNSAPKIYKT